MERVPGCAVWVVMVGDLAGARFQRRSQSGCQCSGVLGVAWRLGAEELSHTPKGVT